VRIEVQKIIHSFSYFKQKIKYFSNKNKEIYISFLKEEIK